MQKRRRDEEEDRVVEESLRVMLQVYLSLYSSIYRTNISTVCFRFSVLLLYAYAIDILMCLTPVPGLDIFDVQFRCGDQCQYDGLRVP